MLAGLHEGRGDGRDQLHADLQHPPPLLVPMLALLESGYEQVAARRDRVGDARLRTIVSRLYYRMVNGLVDVRTEDGAGDFRVLSRSALDALLALGEANRFSKGLFAWIGFRTGYVNYRNVSRAAGQSTWSMRQLFNYGIDSVISFNSKPLRLAIHVGLLITAIAVVYGGVGARRRDRPRHPGAGLRPDRRCRGQVWPGCRWCFSG